MLSLFNLTNAGRADDAIMYGQTIGIFSEDGPVRLEVVSRAMGEKILANHFESHTWH